MQQNERSVGTLSSDVASLQTVDAAASNDYVRTDFLARIAHDLRGPAGVSLGALEEMELSLDASAQSAVAPFLGMARRSVNRILRIAEMLHRSSELAAGRVVWDKRPTELSELVSQAVASVEPRQGVHLRVLGEPAACVLDIDAGWFGCALGELVVTAVEHARREVTVELKVSDGRVWIVVAYDGRGGPLQHVARFSPPSDRSGLGLGMPLVWDVVNAHGGTMDIYGAEGSNEEVAHELQDRNLAMRRVVLGLPLPRLEVQ